MQVCPMYVVSSQKYRVHEYDDGHELYGGSKTARVHDALVVNCGVS